jgi:DNA-binding HxlR family transcriptional regulator
MKKAQRRSDCPIYFALEVFGDAWTLLIVRDLMFKSKTTYTEFLRAGEGISTNILADRLARLEREGIIESVQPASDGYRLTVKGVDLLPILLEIISWSAKHDPATAAPRDFVRRVRTDRARLERELRTGLLVHLNEAPNADTAGTGPAKPARSAKVRALKQRTKRAP